MYLSFLFLFNTISNTKNLSRCRNVSRTMRKTTLELTHIFMKKYFEKTGVEIDIIYLKELWLTLTQDPTYKADMGVTRSRDLNQKLKMNLIPTKRTKKWNCIVGYKMKQPTKEDRLAEVSAYNFYVPKPSCKIIS